MSKEKFNLSESEIVTANLIAKSFSKNCLGKENAINRDVIIERLKAAKNPIEIDRHKLAEMVQYIRVNNLTGPLIETGQEYYISNSKEEMENYLLVLKERSEEIMRMHAAFKKQISKV